MTRLTFTFAFCCLRSSSSSLSISANSGLFENVIGLAFNYSELTEVKLWFNTEQCKYVQSQPFHHSQQVIERNKDGCIVTLSVHPNVELRLMIVKHGANIKVLEPKWLADEVAYIHRKAAELY